MRDFTAVGFWVFRWEFLGSMMGISRERDGDLEMLWFAGDEWTEVCNILRKA